MKKTVAILFGGESSEYEVSCVSAANVAENLDKEIYDLILVGITKDGKWWIYKGTTDDMRNHVWNENYANLVPAIISPCKAHHGLLALDGAKGTFEIVRIDVAFPVLHGKNGEDGTMQGFLQIAGIPFVGSGTSASSASMDKAITKAVIKMAGVVDQANCFVSYKSNFTENECGEIDTALNYFKGEMPLFVKPANAGSSVGITKVKKKEDLRAALITAFNEDDKALIEETIVGREIEVAVLGNDDPEASCIGEIFAANEFYDYNAKYENEASHTAIVTDLTPEKEAEIRKAAVRVYKTMGCKGLARVDFFLTESGRVVFNELNTLPGFTHISMYPQLWEASGVPYAELIDKLITLALEMGDEI